MDNKKIKYIIFSIVAILILVAILLKLVNIILGGFDMVYDEKYDKFKTVGLSDQRSFRMTGEPLYMGLGASTTFAFRMSQAGDSYGVDFYANKNKNRFVGYMTLVDTSTNTKVFAGKMLDKNNQTVDGVIKVYVKDCVLPKIKPVKLSVEAQVGDQTFEGCADMAR